MKFAVIGSPISHSLSPAMHAEFIAELGVNATYEAINGADYGGDLARIFKERSLKGANVTLPYKNAALKLATKASAAAIACAAANTLLLNEDGSFYAHNTDVEGFLAPLADVNLVGMKVLIIGAGGAASAVRFALENVGAQISLLARRVDNDLGAPISLNSTEFAMIVNATSASLKNELPTSKEILHSLTGVQIVYDLAYGYDVFLREFDDKVRKIDGKMMLAEQAAAAAELFYGKRPSDELVAKWAL